MISPTPGRVVWFYDDKRRKEIGIQPRAAIVTEVKSERTVSLAVLDPVNECVKFHAGVPLLQDSDMAPDFGMFCEWMPFQKGQAAKTEALEAQANN